MLNTIATSTTIGSSSSFTSSMPSSTLHARRAAHYAPFDLPQLVVRGADGRLLASVVLPPHEEFQAVCERNTLNFVERSQQLRNPTVDMSCSVLLPTVAANMPVPAAEPPCLFQSRVLPRLSLFELTTAMQRNTQCSDEQLLAAVVLCARYSRISGRKPTMHTMHRLYVTALHVVLKSTCDVYFKNSTYSRLSGVSLAELNRLELEFLNGIEWGPLVTSDDVHDMLRSRDAYFADLNVASVDAKFRDSPVSICVTPTAGSLYLPAVAVSPSAACAGGASHQIRHLKPSDDSWVAGRSSESLDATPRACTVANASLDESGYVA